MPQITSRPAAALMAIVMLAGCGPAPGYAPAPVTIGPSPIEVSLRREVALAPAWELGLEFEEPGDSRLAVWIEAVLLTTDGRRLPLVVLELDRKGERLVALRGSVLPAGADSTELGGAVTAVELRSNREVRLRGVKGSAMGPAPGQAR